MKILIAHGAGGHPATYPRVLADELKRLDCEVVLRDEGAPPSSWAPRLRMNAAARKLVAEHQPDLVHVIAADPAVAEAFSGHGVSVLHSAIDRPSDTDWVIAPSREAFGRFRTAAPFLDYRMTCLPFALDPGEAATGAGTYVLGRATDPKAAAWLEEAAALVPDIPVSDEGEVRDARFLVYLSSKQDAWAPGVAEALAAGRPVIASWGGAASEFVGEAVSGFLSAPGDVAGLAANIDYLWNHPGEALFLGMQARKEAKEHFGVEAHARALLKLYFRAGASRMAV